MVDDSLVAGDVELGAIARGQDDRLMRGTV
jgi:hypothetical protein